MFESDVQFDGRSQDARGSIIQRLASFFFPSILIPNQCSSSSSSASGGKVASCDTGIVGRIRSLVDDFLKKNNSTTGDPSQEPVKKKNTS